MKSSAAVSRVKVSADGHGVVSHAGVGMLRQLADLTGLSAQVTAALADTYRGPWTYDPGAVFAGLAAAVADGADCREGFCTGCRHQLETESSWIMTIIHGKLLRFHQMNQGRCVGAPLVAALLL